MRWRRERWERVECDPVRGGRVLTVPVIEPVRGWRGALLRAGWLLGAASRWAIARALR